MATRTEKDQAIEVLVEEIKATDVLYLADTSSMNAEATSNLRRACHKKGIRMKVVKNTLLQKAMERIEGKDYSELIPTLKGQTSVLFADKGNAPAKLIKNFRKKETKPELKSAWIDEAVFIGDDQLGHAQLPSKAKKNSSARSSACSKARSRTSSAACKAAEDRRSPACSKRSKREPHK